MSVNSSVKQENTLMIVFCFIFFALYLGIGSWEATVIYHSEPKCNDDIDTSDCILATQVFAFIVVKTVINLSVATICLLCILLCIGGAPDIASKLTGYSGSTSMAITVWGLVNYFNLSNEWLKNNYSSFQKVLFVEMIVFFILLGLITMVICLSCCIFCCTTSIKENDTSERQII